MNKGELIAKLSDDAEITKTQANAALDSFIEAVTKTLKGGGKVTLVGFGTFSVSKRAARNGRNPQTGAVIKIKAKKVAKFLRDEGPKTLKTQIQGDELRVIVQSEDGGPEHCFVVHLHAEAVEACA